MNVNAKDWSGLINPKTGKPYTRDELKNPEADVTAGALILKGIASILPKDQQTVTNIATLYQCMFAQQESHYGVRVNKYYKEKPWRRRIEPRPNPPVLAP